jgi:hypothetical protein
MSLLACDRDPVALGVVVTDSGRRVWDLEALEAHVRECRACGSLHSALAAITASRAGRAGRGATKRRGDAGYYRALAGQRAVRKALRIDGGGSTNPVDFGTEPRRGR